MGFAVLHMHKINCSQAWNRCAIQELWGSIMVADRKLYLDSMFLI